MYSIKALLRSISITALVLLSTSMVGTYVANASSDTDKCDFSSDNLVGIPVWYKYLPGERVQQIKMDGSLGDKICQPTIKAVGDEKIPITNILLITAAIIEILIRVAGLAAFIYLIYGGFLYLTSNGSADNVSKAGTTLLNAAIGLAIAISATAFINFFAGRIAQK